MYKVGRSRTPQRVRGLKLQGLLSAYPDVVSHSARSAWIETVHLLSCFAAAPSRTPQGGRGLKHDECKLREDASRRTLQGVRNLSGKEKALQACLV